MKSAVMNGMHPMSNRKETTDHQIKILTVSALLMAMNVIMSSFGIPVPGGHLYLNDCIITTAAILLAPGYAAAVGGIGAFLGDFFFYPTPMFFSLIAHGLQGFLISWAVRKFRGKNDDGFPGAIIGCAIGLVVTTIVYSLGRAAHGRRHRRHPAVLQIRPAEEIQPDVQVAYILPPEFRY